eukprot:431886-Pelagomonas_calceolata.AAC.1
MLKVPDWKTWAVTLMAVVKSRMACKELEQATTALALTEEVLSSPAVLELKEERKIYACRSAAGNTKTICQAELAAIAAAITHSYSYIASDSITSLHRIRKQLIYPERHKQQRKKERSTLAVRLRALRKEPPNDSHR